MIKMTYLTLLMFSDAPDTAAKWRSHPMQLRSAKVQEVSLNNINIGGLAAKQQCDTVVITVEYMYNKCI